TRRPPGFPALPAGRQLEPASARGVSGRARDRAEPGGEPRRETGSDVHDEAPVISIMAHAREEDRGSALAAGCDAHVAKLDPEELHATVAEVAGRGISTAS